METPNPQYHYPSDEIDLREIFKTISQRKYTIIGITIGCMLLAALVSILILKPTYEARAVLSVTSVSKSNNMIIREDNDLNKIRDNIDYIIQLPEMSMQAYQELITSSIILENLKRQLKLNYSLKEIRNMIKTQLNEGNLIEIRVSSSDPELSARIANTLTQEFIIYVSTNNANKMNSFTRMIEDQISSEEIDLQKTSRQLQTMPAMPTGNSQEDLENQMERKKLETEANMRQNVIELLSSKLVEIKIIQAIYMAENTITTVSPATPPAVPAWPNTKLNIVIAAVLGLLISTMGVFMMACMKNGKSSAPRQQSN